MIPSKAEAWTKRDDEISIPVSTKEYKFQFTRRWFRNRNQCTWSTFLPKRFPPDKPIRMIQIGVFEGMDLVWCFQNILKHPDSRCIAVDPWLETTKLSAQYMEEVYERAKHNLRPFRRQLELMRGTSQEVLAKLLPAHADRYDLIVIDGDHNAPAVVQDAELALRLAKVGGWLLFDDVRNDVPKKDHVAQGLETFLIDHPGEVQRVWSHRYCDCFEKVF